MMYVIPVLVVFLFAFSSLVAGFLFTIKKLIYIPKPIKDFQKPPGTVEVFTPVHGLILPDPNTIILYCHGNYGNITERTFIIDFCRHLGIGVFLFDYQGYGRTFKTFSPSIRSIIQDSLKAYRFLKENYKDTRIIVWGESIGGIAAAHIASLEITDGLILLSPLTDIKDVLYSSQIGGFTIYLLSKLISEGKIETYSLAKKILCPTVVIHSKEDILIPIYSSKRFFDLIPIKSKKFITIKGCHSIPEFEHYQLCSLCNFFGFREPDSEWPMKIKRICEKQNRITRKSLHE